MTVKEALLETINIVNMSESPLKEEIVQKISLCIETLYTMKWTKETVFDACNQYMKDTGKQITVRDFDRLERLPCHPTIKRLFGTTAQEFRDTYFPLDKSILYNHSAYNRFSTEELCEMFCKEYLRVRPVSYEDFKHRYDNKNCPAFQTLCKRLGMKSYQWRVVIRCLDLPDIRRESDHPGTKKYVTVKTSKLHKKWSDAYNANNTSE